MTAYTLGVKYFIEIALSGTVSWINAFYAEIQLPKIASEMPVPHILGKYFQLHEIQKYCVSTNFRILSEHCQLYKGPNNV